VTKSKGPDGPGPELPLEGRLKRLEEIVGQLEAEEIELDKALELFEEGIVHVREAERSLAAAELKVEELLRETNEGGDGDGPATRPLDREPG
jgi:exodeoxyribonuclease VII small subunit